MSTETASRRPGARVAPAGPATGDMPAPDEPQDLNRGLIRTDISPRLAWLMTLSFLAAIGALPVVQGVSELVARRPIQALEVGTRTPTRDNLHQYENDLARQSVARQLVQPRLQLALSAALGCGNSDVILGRDGWLFYRPGLAFLTGPGLVDGDRLTLRKKELGDAGEKNPCPDPRPAIVAFHEACRQAGVHLVVVPVPDKALLQPAELTARLAFTTPTAAPTNRGYPGFVADLRAAGVDVFDPTPPQLIPGEAPRFLRQDTHWTPEWMESVAQDLAGHLKNHVPLPPAAAGRFGAQETSISRVGDLVDMLQLPAGQRQYPPQTVRIHRVLAAGGSAWQPRPDADVLLLGDSFSNIYCAGDMGWGDAAGFPAQVARFLNRDVDVIARNGSGATLTRRELARRPDPLGGKRIVIWEFAVRDLTQANWE